MKLSGIMIGTADAKKLGEFWTKILGEPAWRMDDFIGFEQSIMIGPHSEVAPKSEDPKRVIINFECDDVQAEFDRIKGLGAEVIAEPYNPQPDQGDMKLATFADPDGNYFQIAPPWKDDK